MNCRYSLAAPCAALLAFAFGVLLSPNASYAQNISKTGHAGAYAVTLKVLPAESFGGAHPKMVRDGGAMPNYLHGAMHPNHHIVVFVKKNGHPVERAHVTIACRRESTGSSWHKEKVVRMHVAGKSLSTTHYGNNVHLGPGDYEVRVTVNGSKPATFHFPLKS